jgi:hypothetical protein
VTLRSTGWLERDAREIPNRLNDHFTSHDDRASLSQAGGRMSPEVEGLGEVFDPALDPGIEQVVIALRRAGVETFESCEGGAGHAYAEPTVRFHGEVAEGFRALAAAIEARLNVVTLRRAWPIIDGEPTGPWWELTFAGLK